MVKGKKTFNICDDTQIGFELSLKDIIGISLPYPDQVDHEGNRIDCYSYLIMIGTTTLKQYYKDVDKARAKRTDLVVAWKDAI